MSDVSDVNKVNDVCDVYSVDISSDVVRGGSNIGKRDFISGVSLDKIFGCIREYTDKYGRPRLISGALLWISDVGDSYFMSVFKNSRVLIITARKLESILCHTA